MPTPFDPARIQAITFDVFGTLLEQDPGSSKFSSYAYATAVSDVRHGKRPWRPLSAILEEVGADWTTLVPRPALVDSLAALAARYRIAPLSNADSDLSRRIADHFGLPWSTIIDVETAHTFKPDERVYRVALMRLGLVPDRVLHVAAHAYDLEAAARLGFRTAFLRWPGYQADAPTPSGFDIDVPSLVQLVERMIVPARRQP